MKSIWKVSAVVLALVVLALSAAAPVAPAQAAASASPFAGTYAGWSGYGYTYLSIAIAEDGKITGGIAFGDGIGCECQGPASGHVSDQGAMRIHAYSRDLTCGVGCGSRNINLSGDVTLDENGDLVFSTEFGTSVLVRT